MADTKKITISIPSEDLARAQRAVKQGRAGSVSAYIADSLREYDEKQTLRSVLDLLEAKFGRSSEEDDAWARRSLEKNARSRPRPRTRKSA